MKTVFCIYTVQGFLGVRKKVITGLCKLINASVPTKELTICSVGSCVCLSVRRSLDHSVIMSFVLSVVL